MPHQLMSNASQSGALAQTRTNEATSRSTATRAALAGLSFDEQVQALATDPPVVSPNGVHVVRAEESLWGIAKAYGVTVDDLKTANGLTSNVIREGQQLKMPKGWTPKAGPVLNKTEGKTEAKTEGKTEVSSQDPVTLLKAIVGQSRAPTAAEWKILASGIEKLRSGFQTGLRLCLTMSRVSWENITDDQRTVFMAIKDRETLRKELLKNSALFNAMTAVHVLLTHKDDRSAAADFQDTEKMRLREKDADLPVMGWSNTVANNLVSSSNEGSINRAAIIDPALAASPSSFKNSGLAKWVGKQGTPEQQKAGDKRAIADAAAEAIHPYACGYSNIFALALASGKVTGQEPPRLGADGKLAGGRLPTQQDAIAWMRKWTLDAANGTGLLGVSGDGSKLDYTPANALAGLGRGEFTKVATDIETPHKKKAGVADADFQAALDQALGKLGAGHAASRLALAQGNGMIENEKKVHTFVLYRDVDDVWRSMDVYVGLEDHAGKSGERYVYSPELSSVRFSNR